MWQQCWNERVLLQRTQARITHQPSGAQIQRGGYSFETKVFILFSFLEDEYKCVWMPLICRQELGCSHHPHCLFCSVSFFHFSINELLEGNLARENVFRCLWRCKNSKRNVLWHKHQRSAQEESKDFCQSISLPISCNASTAVCFLMQGTSLLILVPPMHEKMHGTLQLQNSTSHFYTSSSPKWCQLFFLGSHTSKSSGMQLAALLSLSWE